MACALAVEWHRAMIGTELGHRSDGSGFELGCIFHQACLGAIPRACGADWWLDRVLCVSPIRRDWIVRGSAFDPKRTVEKSQNDLRGTQCGDASALDAMAFESGPRCLSGAMVPR